MKKRREIVYMHMHHFTRYEHLKMIYNLKLESFFLHIYNNRMFRNSFARKGFSTWKYSKLRRNQTPWTPCVVVYDLANMCSGRELEVMAWRGMRVCLSKWFEWLVIWVIWWICNDFEWILVLVVFLLIFFMIKLY